MRGIHHLLQGNWYGFLAVAAAGQVVGEKDHDSARVPKCANVTFHTRGIASTSVTYRDVRSFSESGKAEGPVETHESHGGRLSRARKFGFNFHVAVIEI